MVEAYALQTDRQAEPHGVVEAPEFSWRLRSSRRGAAQTAYRIVVRADLGVDEPATVWDTGWRETDAVFGVRYGGMPLVSSRRYEWTLHLRDDIGAVSERTALFWTAIVHPGEWRGVWIGRNPIYRQDAPVPQDTDITYTVNKLKPVRQFVHHFALDELPRTAVLHIAVRGLYRAYLNGKRIGIDELVPGWTEYRERLPYQSHDVADLLIEGRNSLAFLVADGWWCGFIGTDRRHQAQHYGEEPALLAQLDGAYADGSPLTLQSGEGWRERASEIVYADLLMGQYEDGRRIDPGWHLPDVDLSEWSKAVVVDDDRSTLVPESDVPVRVTDLLPARSVATIAPGRHIVDFGQNLVGHVRLTIRDAPADTRVQLEHAEVLKEDGTLYTENLRTVEARDVYWTREAAVQVFEPRFTLHGFRYLEILGLPEAPLLDDVTAVVVHNGFETTGFLETSDADLNQLASNIRWGMKGNFVSIPTDCPQRDERMGWTADAQVFAPTACYQADLLAFLRRWMRDVRSAQSPEGAFPDTAPHMVHVREGAPAWGDAGVTIPWHLYRTYGSVDVLREAADSMIAWVRYIERNNPGLIWRERLGNNYGDWLQVVETTPKDVLSTAYFARSTDLTARTLRVLGRDDEAAELEDLLEGIKRAFRDEFIDGDGRVTGDTQTCYLLTLAFDLAPVEQRESIAARLVETVERRDRSLTTGFVGVALLCPILTAIGRSDLAYDLVHNDRYPSWLYSVRNGATTIWERWDGWTAEHGFQSARMNSFNHYSLGSVGEWLYRSIGGIDQTDDSVAFDRPLIAPQFDPALAWARASYQSARGEISTAWRRSEGRIEFDLTLPPGVVAVVTLPVADASEVEEGGRSASRAEGVALVTSDGGTVQITVGSGSYRFGIPDTVR